MTATAQRRTRTPVAGEESPARPVLAAQLGRDRAHEVDVLIVRERRGLAGNHEPALENGGLGGEFTCPEGECGNERCCATQHLPTHWCFAPRHGGTSL